MSGNLGGISGSAIEQQAFRFFASSKWSLVPCCIWLVFRLSYVLPTKAFLICLGSSDRTGWGLCPGGWVFHALYTTYYVRLALVQGTHSVKSMRVLEDQKEIGYTILKRCRTGYFNFLILARAKGTVAFLDFCFFAIIIPQSAYYNQLYYLIQPVVKCGCHSTKSCMHSWCDSKVLNTQVMASKFDANW